MDKTPAKRDGGFAIVANPDSSAALQEAYSELGIDSFSLNRVSIPAGGGTAFQLESLEGTENLSDVDIIVAGIKGNEKVWWRDDFNGNGGPPDCSSHDGVTGFGNPTKDPDKEPQGNSCSACPWNKWESSRSGGPGKDCGDIAFLIFFQPDAFLPDMLVVPPSSLKAVREYSMKLMRAGKNPRRVVTRMSLEQAQSASGIKYSQLKLGYVKDLEESEVGVMDDVGKLVMASFAPTALTTPVVDQSQLTN